VSDLSSPPALDLAATWRAARTGAVLLPGGDRGLVRVAGPDAPDFLQRLLTSDVLDLEPGAGQWSAWLDPRGRWRADLLLLRLPEDAPGATGQPGFLLDCPVEVQEEIRAGLEGLHFTEDLRIAGSPPGDARLLLAGPGGPEALAAAGLPVPGTADPGAAVAAAGDGLLVLRRPDRGCPCLELLGAGEAVASLGRRLALPAGDPAALEVLRIAAFRPRFGRDFGPEDLLPEAEEWQRVSPTKGCYPGQEVVAKIRTFGEAPWRLCRLRSEAPVEGLVGAVLTGEDGEEAGRVTSWAVLPGGGACGLGRIRRRFAAHTRLTARGSAGPVPLAAETPPPPAP